MASRGTAASYRSESSEPANEPPSTDNSARLALSCSPLDGTRARCVAGESGDPSSPGNLLRCASYLAVGRGLAECAVDDSLVGPSLALEDA